MNTSTRALAQSSQLRFQPKAVGLAASLLCALIAAEASAQTPATPESLEIVVVQGMRASLTKAQDLKRNADQIVDSIVADDIGKLPDANVAEALQRIAGVQISRNRGEGDRVQVRGLSQVQTLLNGRSIFTAGKERGLSFQDVPSELLAGADIYKTPTADQVEGGIGGLIDLRTRRPFDFAGQKVAGTLKSSYADLAKKSNIEGSVLLSNRWKLSDGGEFGALVSVAKQKRNYRADTQELSAPAQLADGSGLYAPTGVWYSYELGSRDRTGVTAALQYRPSAALEFTLDANHTRLKSKTDTYGFYGSPFWANYSATTNSGALWPVAGTIQQDDGVFKKGTFWGDQMSLSSFIADNDTKTTQVATGVRWKGQDWTVKSELGSTKSDYRRLYQEARLGAWTNNAQFAFDMTTGTPSAYPVLPNPGDLTAPAQYYADKALYFLQQNSGKETTFRLDGDRRFEGSFFSRVRTGLRLSDRKATSAEINTIDSVWSGTATSPISGANQAYYDKLGVIPYDNLLSAAKDGMVPKQWLGVADLNWLRDPAAFRGAFGLTVPSFDSAQVFDYREKTSAIYGVLDFDSEAFGLPWSGNLGLRYVNTRINRAYTDTSTGTPTPRNRHDNDNDLLPSLNMRLDITDKLVARLAGSKVITQPNFDQLTPSLSLNANDKTGYLGNPELKALTARQFDASLEYYLNKSDHVYGAAFYKKVNGFIQTSASPLAYQGTQYTVSTPSNGQDGTIRGAELGYQAFFTNLPGALRGFGLQANYTYVDSSAPGPLGGQKTQLQGLSRDSYNLIGMYDYQDLSLRLAYNYRGKYLVGTLNYYPNNGNSIGQTSTYLRGYGMVDAYASYALTRQLKIAIEANNLTRTVRRGYYDIANLARGTYVDDRRYAISLQMEL